MHEEDCIPKLKIEIDQENLLVLRGELIAEIGCQESRAASPLTWDKGEHPRGLLGLRSDTETLLNTVDAREQDLLCRRRVQHLPDAGTHGPHQEFGRLIRAQHYECSVRVMNGYIFHHAEVG